MHPLFKEKAQTTFIAVRNPTTDIFKRAERVAMPMIGVIKVLPDDFDEGDIPQKTISGDSDFLSALSWLADQMDVMHELSSYTSGEPQPFLSAGFGEIKKTMDFINRCVAHK